jgi:hypothetical protein
MGIFVRRPEGFADRLDRAGAAEDTELAEIAYSVTSAPLPFKKNGIKTKNGPLPRLEPHRH